MVAAASPVNPTLAVQYGTNNDMSSKTAPIVDPTSGKLNFKDPKIIVLLVVFGLLLVLSAYSMYRRYRMNRLLERVSELTQRRSQLLEEKQFMTSMAMAQRASQMLPKRKRKTKKRKSKKRKTRRVR